MRPEIDLYLERQSVLQGQEVKGRLSVRRGSGARSLTVSLQGEEMLGAGSLIRSYVYPVVDEVLEFDLADRPSDFEEDFSFRIPEGAPPSYASPDVRCQYYLKARLQQGGRLSLGRLGGDTIKRLHITVLPPHEEESPDSPHELVLADGGVKLVAVLDRTALASGESLRGGLMLYRESEETPLPTRITFRLAAIEESLEPSYRHREVLWVQSHDVEPGEEMEYPVEGVFEFPIDADAPFTGEWTSFKLHYGFRVGMNLAGGRQIRESLPIHVYREYVPTEPGSG